MMRVDTIRLVERDGGWVDLCEGEKGGRVIISLRPPEGGGAEELREAIEEEGGMRVFLRKLGQFILAHSHGTN